jgi:hypothetical protein
VLANIQVPNHFENDLELFSQFNPPKTTFSIPVHKPSFQFPDRNHCVTTDLNQIIVLLNSLIILIFF